MKKVAIRIAVGLSIAMSLCSRMSHALCGRVDYAWPAPSRAVEPPRYRFEAACGDMQWCGVRPSPSGLAACFQKYLVQIDQVTAESFDLAAIVASQGSGMTEDVRRRGLVRAEQVLNAAAAAEDELIGGIRDDIVTRAETEEQAAHLRDAVQLWSRLRALDRTIEATRSLSIWLQPSISLPWSVGADLRARVDPSALEEPVRTKLLNVMLENSGRSIGAWSRYHARLAQQRELSENKGPDAATSDAARLETQALRRGALELAIAFSQILPKRVAAVLESHRPFLLGVEVPYLTLPGPNGALLTPRDVVGVLLRQAQSGGGSNERARALCSKWLAEDDQIVLSLMLQAANPGDGPLDEGGPIPDRQAVADRYLAALSKELKATWLTDQTQEMPALDSLPKLDANDLDLTGQIEPPKKAEDSEPSWASMYSLPSPPARREAMQVIDDLGLGPAERLVAETLFADFVSKWNEDVVPLVMAFKAQYDRVRQFPAEAVNTPPRVAAIDSLCALLASRREAWARSDRLEDGYFASLEAAIAEVRPGALGSLRASRLARTLDTLSREAARVVPGHSGRVPNAFRLALTVPASSARRKAFIEAASTPGLLDTAANRTVRDSLLDLKDAHILNWARSERLEMDLLAGRVSEDDRGRLVQSIEARAAERHRQESALGLRLSEVVQAANRNVLAKLGENDARIMGLWLAMDECFRTMGAALSSLPMHKLAQEAGSADEASTVPTRIEGWLLRNADVITKLRAFMNRQLPRGAMRPDESNSPASYSLLCSLKDELLLVQFTPGLDVKVEHSAEAEMAGK